MTSPGMRRRRSRRRKTPTSHSLKYSVVVCTMLAAVKRSRLYWSSAFPLVFSGCDGRLCHACCFFGLQLLQVTQSQILSYTRAACFQVGFEFSFPNVCSSHCCHCGCP